MTVAGAPYGLALEDVQEVIGMRTLTRVFHAPAAVAGVTSLRGEVLPVLDGMIGDGLVTTERVQVRSYRGTARS